MGRGALPRLRVIHESWPCAGSFRISRGSKTSAEVVVVELEQDGAIGRGEGVPYSRYGESIPQVTEALEQARGAIERGCGRADVPGLVLPRSARNALDCAMWDLEAKLTGMPVWKRAGLAPPEPLVTAYTLVLETPENMAKAARAASDRPLFKLKLGGEGDEERLRQVRSAAPDSRLIVDANEGWTVRQLPRLLALCAETGVELVEQPLPADEDEALRRLTRDVPVCADESAHDADGLAALLGKYDAINIKLDKAGGLTPALGLAREAQALGFTIMTGCMLSTSLAMAPAMLVAQLGHVTDLDGPLLLAKDRVPGIAYAGSRMEPPSRELWG
ncbi:MAG TPA: N-acetyl-D-Glu racemase DgcA [Sphingomicrobium sp.]|nr:N-acetyl-D-Glu racemase DgcA [Sphingomicrobium sp.]